MQITYLSNSRIPTGRAHGLQIMYMCAEFAKEGAEVELVVPAKRNFREVDPFAFYKVPATFKIRRIPVPDLASKTAAFPALMFFADVLLYGIALLFQQFLRGEGVIYTRDYMLLFFLPRRSRIVLEVHDVPRSTWIFRKALKRAALFVAITNGVKEALVSLGVPAERITIAPDGVHLKDFENPESRESARRRLGLPLEAKIAMYIGWIDGWKGTDTLFEAAARLKGVRVVVIGGLPAQVNILSRRYPHITFLGMRPYHELPHNQAAADVLVLPASGKHAISARYTSPLKLFTYMTSGIPIIASDVPSLREVIDEDSAFLFRPDDPKDLVRVIEYAIAHTQKGAEKARIAKSKVARYTWSERAKTILRFLRERQ